MKAVSVDLIDRKLWYDGDSTVSEDYIVRTISQGGSVDGLCIDVLTPAIEQYNQFADVNQQIRTKDGIGDLDLDWNIPDKYKHIDVEKYITTKFMEELKSSNFSQKERDVRMVRIQEEIQLYENLGFINVLRTLIFIINTLEEHSVVWGVGRGSSVASYILYLIGVHDVDSVVYELDIAEFLRTNN